jgi:hypothetical protein
VPVSGAFSYKIKKSNGPETPKAEPSPIELSCEQTHVRPGERVTVLGTSAHEIVIPATAKPGEHLWFEREGSWIDFTVKGGP